MTQPTLPLRRSATSWECRTSLTRRIFWNGNIDPTICLWPMWVRNQFSRIQQRLSKRLPARSLIRAPQFIYLWKPERLRALMTPPLTRPRRETPPARLHADFPFQDGLGVGSGPVNSPERNGNARRNQFRPPVRSSKPRWWLLPSQRIARKFRSKPKNDHGW